MHFRLIDTVLERGRDRVVAVKNVTAAEEYLQDHFPGFPVLPGVFMIEAMVQAARESLEGSGHMVLGSVRGVRYGNFVRPGEALRVEVTREREEPGGTVHFKGSGTVLRQGGMGSDTAVSGRFTMRPVRRDIA